MSDRQTKLLRIHLVGYFQVVLYLFGVSLLSLWALQIFALAYDISANWSALLFQMHISLCFLAFFPGQSFWRYEVTDTDGRTHVIVGPFEDRG